MAKDTVWYYVSCITPFTARRSSNDVGPGLVFSKRRTWSNYLNSMVDTTCRILPSTQLRIFPSFPMSVQILIPVSFLPTVPFCNITIQYFTCRRTFITFEYTFRYWTIPVHQFLFLTYREKCCQFGHLWSLKRFFYFMFVCCEQRFLLFNQMNTEHSISQLSETLLPWWIQKSVNTLQM